MARRAAYTELAKTGQVRPAHVQGKGDLVYRGFQCPQASCPNWLFVPADDLAVSFEVSCGSCNNVIRSGDVVKLFNYELVDKRDGRIIESGPFDLFVDDYIEEAEEYKYCVICYCMKPLALFDKHAARRSGRQGECTLCKRMYNSIKNQTRLTDQHREAAQKRRLYLDVGGWDKIDSRAVRDRFRDTCFNCGGQVPPREGHLDHTLPAYYLWPLTSENATLLCGTCNGRKTGHWPAAFYNEAQLRRLATTTGIDYRVLTGPPIYNPVALKRLQDAVFVDQMVQKYAAYMDELIQLRNRLLAATGVDFFVVATSLSGRYVREANERL